MVYNGVYHMMCDLKFARGRVPCWRDCGELSSMITN